MELEHRINLVLCPNSILTRVHIIFCHFTLSPAIRIQTHTSHCSALKVPYYKACLHAKYCESVKTLDQWRNEHSPYSETVPVNEPSELYSHHPQLFPQHGPPGPIVRPFVVVLSLLTTQHQEVILSLSQQAKKQKNVEETLHNRWMSGRLLSPSTKDYTFFSPRHFSLSHIDYFFISSYL